jgi:hypothetical protein
VAQDLSYASTLVERCMDISTIKPPVEKIDVEPHAGAPDGSESAFLQLLASLGLTQPIPVDAGRGPLVKDETLAQTESLHVDTEALARALAADGLQEKLVAVVNANGRATQDETTPQALLPQVITSAGTAKSDSTGTALAQAVSMGAKDMPVKDQAMAAEGKPGTALPDAKGSTESLPPTAPNDEPHAGSTRLMEVLFSGHVAKERGSASPASAASTSLAPTVAGQFAMSQAGSHDGFFARSDHWAGIICSAAVWNTRQPRFSRARWVKGTIHASGGGWWPTPVDAYHSFIEFPIRFHFGQDDAHGVRGSSDCRGTSGIAPPCLHPI